MLEFLEGVARPAHQEVVDKVVHKLVKKNRGMKIKKLKINHCNNITFLSVALGSDKECKDTRLIMVGKMGGVRLLNAKASSKAKTRGVYNVVHGVTQ